MDCFVHIDNEKSSSRQNAIRSRQNFEIAINIVKSLRLRTCDAKFPRTETENHDKAGCEKGSQNLRYRISFIINTEIILEFNIVISLDKNVASSKLSFQSKYLLYHVSLHTSCRTRTA